MVAIGTWIGLSVAAGFATVVVANAVTPEWAAGPDNLAVVLTSEVYALLVACMLLLVGEGSRNSSALALKRPSTRDIATGLVALAGVDAVVAVMHVVVDVIAQPDPSMLDIVLGIGSDDGRLADAGFWATALIFFRILVLVPLGEERAIAAGAATRSYQLRSAAVPMPSPA